MQRWDYLTVNYRGLINCADPQPIADGLKGVFPKVRAYEIKVGQNEVSYADLPLLGVMIALGQLGWEAVGVVLPSSDTILMKRALE